MTAPTKATRGKDKKAVPVSVFEILAQETDGSGAEEEVEDVEEEEAEEEMEEEEAAGSLSTPPVPIVAKIVGVKQHPKADRLRIVKLAAGPHLGEVQVVTNAPNLDKHQLVALAVRRPVCLGLAGAC